MSQKYVLIQTQAVRIASTERSRLLCRHNILKKKLASNIEQWHIESEWAYSRSGRFLNWHPIKYVNLGCFKREKSATKLKLLLHTAYLWRQTSKLLISNHFWTDLFFFLLNCNWTACGR